MQEPSFVSSLTEIHRLCWMALMAALIASGAFFHISIGPVPITLQDFFIALTGMILGPRHGVYAYGLYVLAGAAGLPVFSGGRAGLGHMAGPTGGYFAGFVLLAICSGLGARRAARRAEKTPGRPLGLLSLLTAVAGGMVGMAFLYLFGAGWLAHLLDVTAAQAFTLGVAPFLPLAPVKIVFCVLLWRSLYQRGLLPC